MKKQRPRTTEPPADPEAMTHASYRLKVGEKERVAKLAAALSTNLDKISPGKMTRRLVLYALPLLEAEVTP